jgi:aspartate ammonia-lyase
MARSVSIVTALTPHLGYAAAAEIAKSALAGGGFVRDLALAMGWTDAEQLDRLLQPERLAGIVVTAEPS